MSAGSSALFFVKRKINNAISIVCSNARFRKENCASAPTPPAQELVKLQRGAKFVVIFGCPRKYVSDGIQVLPAGAGGGENAELRQVPEGGRFGRAKLDLDGLMARCVVDSINVRESAGYCRVYVNCTVGTSAASGLHFWSGGAYAPFIKKALAHTWGRAVLKSQEGRMSLEMRKMSGGDAAVKLRFAIE